GADRWLDRNVAGNTDNAASVVFPFRRKHFLDCIVDVDDHDYCPVIGEAGRKMPSQNSGTSSYYCNLSRQGEGPMTRWTASIHRSRHQCFNDFKIERGFDLA